MNVVRTWLDANLTFCHTLLAIILRILQPSLDVREDDNAVFNTHDCMSYLLERADVWQPREQNMSEQLWVFITV